jgi:hypothetical protein
VRTQIVVEAPIARAFSVFTEEFDRIKPREHNMLDVEIAETVFEPREGGRIYAGRTRAPQPRPPRRGLGGRA